jgi:Lrp/AsnC family transcriptional regulator
VTPATLWRRLDRLREGGVIRSEGAVIDWRALGYSVEVSLRFTLDKTNPRAFDEFIAAARLVPEVIGIETFLGRVDVRLNVIARDMGHWTGIYRDRILALPHIAEVEALMLVATIKDTGGLPL